MLLKQVKAQHKYFTSQQCNAVTHCNSKTTDVVVQVFAIGAASRWSPGRLRRSQNRLRLFRVQRFFAVMLPRHYVVDMDLPTSFTLARNTTSIVEI